MHIKEEQAENRRDIFKASPAINQQVVFKHVDAVTVFISCKAQTSWQDYHWYNKWKQCKLIKCIALGNHHGTACCCNKQMA